MAFASTSQELWLEDNHILHATCEDAEGNWHSSSIDLNEYIGNQDGYFMWEGENFSETATDVQLNDSFLTANLSTVDGEFRERQGIDLNDRIGNDNGKLVCN